MKNIRLLYSIFLACSVTYQTKNIKQGLHGIIIIRQGNYMPSPGRKPDVGKAAIRTNVFIYALTNRGQATGNGTYFDHIQTRLVAKTQTDAEGKYSVALPVGLYSVFTGDNGPLYANSFDGKGNINPVKVYQDSVSTKNITISANAVY